MLIMPPLNRGGKTPLYVQIYRYLRELIEQGELTEGTALPSRRSMASLCGVSGLTVENAYAQLAAEGYVEPKPKSGFYVAHQFKQQENADDASVTASAEQSAGRTKPIRFDCSFGRADELSFPGKIWNRLYREELGKALRRGDPQGEAALREALCSYLHRLRGVSCEPSRMVVGTGLESLILSLLPLFPHSAKFGMELYGYAPYRKLLRAYGREVMTVHSDGGGVDVHALHITMPDVLFLQPSHRFPLGGVLSAGRRRYLLTWAQWAGAYILEDDYDSELRYKGLPIPPMQTMDSGGRVIYLGSFSNCLSPGLRIGYMALPPVPAGVWHRRSDHLQCGVPVPEQLTLARFIREGYLERHIARVRTLYRRRRETLLELLKPLEPRITAEDDGAGLFVRLTVHLAGGEANLLERAANSGVRLTGTERFFFGDPVPYRPTRILMGFGGLDEEQLRAAVEILGRVWRT